MKLDKVYRGEYVHVKCSKLLGHSRHTYWVVVTVSWNGNSSDQRRYKVHSMVVQNIDSRDVPHSCCWFVLHLPKSL